jgi:hypothetical protein
LVPPELALKSGNLKISISIYDINEETNKILFAWHTAVLQSLNVASTSADISSGKNNLPAKNEILFINTETRQIMAPQGYNNVIANYGDVNTSEIYFQIKRFFKGIDLTEDGVDIKITADVGGDIHTYVLENKTTNLDEKQEGEGLLNIIWNVPQEITYNESGFIGTIPISITIAKQG